MKNRVRELALGQGIPNANALSVETGISDSTCYDYWNKPSQIPNPKNIAILSKHLACSADELISYDDHQTPNIDIDPSSIKQHHLQALTTLSRLAKEQGVSLNCLVHYLQQSKPDTFF